MSAQEWHAVLTDGGLWDVTPLGLADGEYGCGLLCESDARLIESAPRMRAALEAISGLGTDVAAGDDGLSFYRRSLQVAINMATRALDT